MFQLHRNFLKINDDLFEVKKTLKEEFMDGKNLDDFKIWYGVEAVFKKDGLLYFCVKINELEILN
jgi:hypothetical protein